LTGYLKAIKNAGIVAEIVYIFEIILTSRFYSFSLIELNMGLLRCPILVDMNAIYTHIRPPSGWNIQLLFGYGCLPNFKSMPLECFLPYGKRDNAAGKRGSAGKDVV
jgi:hypothetical protein